MATINNIVSPDSNLVEILARNKRQFLLQITNNTTYIKMRGEINRNILFAAFKISLSDLAFIQKVKAEMKSNEIDVRIPHKVAYFKFKKIKDGTFKNLVEIDLSSAYWFIAKEKLGYISDETFEKGNLKEKKIRLMALGSAASTKKQHFFDGEKYIKLDPLENEHGKNAFYNIAAVLDIFMIQLYEKYGDKIIGYWTDAFFVDKSIAANVKRDITRFGAKYKTIDIKKLVKKTSKKGVVTITVYENGGKNRKKPFTYFDESMRIEAHIRQFNELVALTGDFD